MKKKLISLVVLFCSTFFAVSYVHAKPNKLLATPETAKIYIDGNYVGDGMYPLKFQGTDFFNVKVEAPGYVTKQLRVYKADSRKVISVDLRKDDSLEGSVATELANKYFTIQCRDGLDEATAWKVLSSVLLNYFDEVKTADKSSGFMNTAWTTQTFPMAEVKVRTMVQIKQVINEGLAYQIKISSEFAPIDTYGEQGYRQWSRVLKKYEPLINEMQQRLGGK